MPSHISMHAHYPVLTRSCVPGQAKLLIPSHKPLKAIPIPAGMASVAW